jgi:hypothetical protein
MRRTSGPLVFLLSLIALTFAMPAVAQHGTNEPAGLLIHLKTGVTLNYVVQGKAGGPVIILLHGAGDSWHSYERVLPLLPADYRVYAITLRGHGLSDHPEAGYSRVDFAGDILDFMNQLNIQHSHAGGAFPGQLCGAKSCGAGHRPPQPACAHRFRSGDCKEF